MSDIIKGQDNNEVTVVRGPALPEKKARVQALVANPVGYVSHALEAIRSHIDNYGEAVVSSDEDRMIDAETKTRAAAEYLELIAMQDYIAHRLEEIKSTFYNTLDERDLSEVDDLPEWAETAPPNVIPGEIGIEDVGIKFQRAGGAPKGMTVNERALKRDHPRIYKDFVVQTVIPATEEQVVDVFDIESFVERAKNDAKLRKFISQNYGTVSFRAYNIFED